MNYDTAKHDALKVVLDNLIMAQTSLLNVLKAKQPAFEVDPVRYNDIQKVINEITIVISECEVKLEELAADRKVQETMAQVMSIFKA